MVSLPGLYEENKKFCYQVATDYFDGVGSGLNNEITTGSKESTR